MRAIPGPDGKDGKDGKREAVDVHAAVRALRRMEIDTLT
ncbi:hypothetical protein ISF6_4802 [Piscinibacter sakaiensis]|uniref:Uncharacterized protein n=1 Tax=Piscinibacter sakaiensis TaxID=1547922 RepID=A0A0K8P748_PISS1|nr:hypothetical protein ISF6_4802 [Piscinibacter sakaiensis]